MIFFELFMAFFRIGCFSFGGAYGSIPLIREVVLSYGWMTDDTLTYMIAVSESTPGPIMINLATFVGSDQAGFLGATTATVAVALPSFIILIVVMIVMKNILKNRYVQAVIRGLKPCIAGIILATGFYMIINNCLIHTEEGELRVKTIVLTVVLGLILFGSEKILKKKTSPVLLITISAFMGMFTYGI